MCLCVVKFCVISFNGIIIFVFYENDMEVNKCITIKLKFHLKTKLAYSRVTMKFSIPNDEMTKKIPILLIHFLRRNRSA